MRRLTLSQACRRADTQQGEMLVFENCLGGYFSEHETYGLKVEGKTVYKQDSSSHLRRVAKNSEISVGEKICLGAENMNVVKKAFFSDYTQENGSIYIKGTMTEPDRSYTYKNGFFTLENPMVSDKISFLNFDIQVYSLYSGSEKGYIFINGNYNNGAYPLVSGRHSIDLTGFEGEIHDFEIRVCGGELEFSNFSVDYHLCKENRIFTPCDLFENDAWFPASGKVYRADGSVEQYPPQRLWAPEKTVKVFQSPIEESASLSATMFTRR